MPSPVHGNAPAPPALIPSPRPNADADSCQRVMTLPQRTGVCWFTALMMAFFYSDGMKALLLDRLTKWRVQGDGTLAKRKRKLYSVFKDLLTAKQTYAVKEEDYKVFELLSPERILRLLHLADRTAFDFNPRVREGFLSERYLHPLLWFMHVGSAFLYKSLDANDNALYVDWNRIYVPPEYGTTPDVLIVITNVEPNYLSRYGFKPSPSTTLDTTHDMKTITFKGIPYHLDSNILSNFNACSMGHAIAGITCRGKRFVYNGWMRQTVDPAMLAAGIQSLKDDPYPCELMPYDWDSNDGDFCLNPNTCKLDPWMPNKAAFSTFCFNFQKGNRIKLYVRDPKQAIAMTNGTVHGVHGVHGVHPGDVPTNRLLNDQQLQCIRQVSNWSQLTNAYKFEHPEFDPKKFLRDLPILSPKLQALVDRIQALDAADRKAHKKVFKHFIFSDLKRGYGAKIVASALLASGYTMAFGPDHKLKSSKQLAATKKGKIMALLCSTELYGKPLSVKFKKEVLGLYNSRPENVHGDQIRFIVLDSGFKEGIDLFDIKYVHLFEPQTSAADTQQVIGRGTRTCGQQGLVFHPTRGWPLHVSIYDVGLPDDLKELDFMADTLFEFYMDNSGLDMRRLRLAETLEQMAASAAVDRDLTQAVHAFRLDNQEQSGGGPRAQVSAQAQAIWTGACATLGPCKKRPTLDFPVSTPLLLAAWLALPDVDQLWAPLLDATEKGNERTLTPREIICTMVKHDKPLCKLLKKEALVNQAKFLAKHERIIRQNLDLLSASGRLSAYYIRLVKALFPTSAPAKPKTKTKTLPKPKKTPFPSPVPSPPTPSPSPSPAPSPSLPESRFERLRARIWQEYAHHAWPPVRMVNGCADPPVIKDKGAGKGKGKKEDSAHSTLSFTPTQSFLAAYFTPQNPTKGMLLYHSVGTGKTCSAIAVATASFEPQGYTILWVTRTTLKNDIWKNMFDQVCSLQLRGKDKAIPKDPAARRRMLSKAWAIPPMSYKQFTNLIAKKNQFYKQLVEINGAADPLRKTLLVIDEAHKLYAENTDLSPIERPDTEALYKALTHSYAVSGADSVRPLLMTATPFTNNPMELMQLLNLCRPKDAALPTDFDAFADVYLNPEGQFSEAGGAAFRDHVAGHVSYLNRAFDPRQFAQPVRKVVTAPLSRLQTPDFSSVKELTAKTENDMAALEREMVFAMQAKNAADQIKVQTDTLLPNAIQACQTQHSVATAQRKCVAEAKRKVQTLKKVLTQEKRKWMAEAKKVVQRRVALRESRRNIRRQLEADMSQEHILMEQCIEAGNA